MSRFQLEVDGYSKAKSRALFNSGAKLLLGILRLEFGLQDPQLLITHDPPHAFLHRQRRRRRPPQHHLSIPPVRDPPRTLADAGIRRFDDIRRGQTTPQGRVMVRRMQGTEWRIYAVDCGPTDLTV